MQNLIVISSIIFPCMYVGFIVRNECERLVKTQASKDDQVDFTRVSRVAYPQKETRVEHMIGRWRVMLGWMFREYFAGRPYLWDTHENSRLAWLFAFQSCALHVALLRVSFSRDTCENHLFILWTLSLHTLSHSSLTIRNPHTYKEKWLKKLQSNLTRN